MKYENEKPQNSSNPLFTLWNVFRDIEELNKSYLDSRVELTAEVTSVFSRIWCVQYGAVGETFFKGGTGKAGQEPKTHAHT